MKYQSIYIIGAGIAGLAAASKLKEKGFKVTLLEAKNYAGGRIKTDYSLGIPFPMGAAFVHGDYNSIIYRLIQKYNPKLYDFNQASAIIFDSNNQTTTTTRLGKTRNYFEQILKKSRRQMQLETKDIPLQESINHILKQDGYQLNEMELNWELLYLSLFTGIETKFLSAKHWDQMGDFNGDHLLLTSYDDLIKDLEKDQEIHFNTQVNHIEYSGRRVKLTTNKGNFESEKIIITVPLGVLQSNQITFDPMLPETKKLAIQNLKMGQLTKVGLLFPYQFWPNDAVIIGFNSTLADAVPLFFNLAYFFEKPILLGAISGETAIQLENAGKNQLVEQAISTLRQLFGNDIPNPIASIATNWATDPFSYGAYSYIPVSASGNDFDVLADTVGDKLFFAGEASYRECHSTVQGAYLSGVREAMKIISIS